MDEKQARSIVGRANVKKKWEKYKTLEERRKLLSKAHEARRQRAKERRDLSTGKLQ